ncbi:MAG: hypothetical protein WC483_01200 [Candidatus Paceibacterota bacterium]
MSTLSSAGSRRKRELSSSKRTAIFSSSIERAMISRRRKESLAMTLTGDVSPILSTHALMNVFLPSRLVVIWMASEKKRYNPSLPSSHDVPHPRTGMGIGLPRPLGSPLDRVEDVCVLSVHEPDVCPMRQLNEQTQIRHSIRDNSAIVEDIGKGIHHLLRLRVVREYARRSILLLDTVQAVVEDPHRLSDSDATTAPDGWERDLSLPQSIIGREARQEMMIRSKSIIADREESVSDSAEVRRLASPILIRVASTAKRSTPRLDLVYEYDGVGGMPVLHRPQDAVEIMLGLHGVGLDQRWIGEGSRDRGGLATPSTILPFEEFFLIAQEEETHVRRGTSRLLFLPFGHITDSAPSHDCWRSRRSLCHAYRFGFVNTALRRHLMTRRRNHFRSLSHRGRRADRLAYREKKICRRRRCHHMREQLRRRN